jgi:hypothetical protein
MVSLFCKNICIYKNGLGNAHPALLRMDITLSVQTLDKDTGLLGFGTFSIVWYSTERDVSETGSVSVLRRRRGKNNYSIGPLRKS